MNTLSFPALVAKLRRSQAISAPLKAFSARQFPLEIEGAEGTFAALLLSELYRSSPGSFLVVVPTEKEAAELASDLQIAGTPVIRLPWWGTMPYRDMAPGAAVFGEAVDPWVILGGAIILAAVVFLTWREARRQPSQGRI